MPKPLEVTFAESAILDLGDIREYYREKLVPEVSERFLNEIIALVEDLALHPDRGRIVPEFNQPLSRS